MFLLVYSLLARFVFPPRWVGSEVVRLSPASAFGMIGPPSNGRCSRR